MNGKNPFYGRSTGYRPQPRPTEFIWASNLATLLIDCVDTAAALWKELALYGRVKPGSFEVFMQNFRSLVYHTSEYISREDGKKEIVNEAEELFNNDLRLNKLNYDAVSHALETFSKYNKAIHHTKALIKIIEEVNIVVDDGT